MQARFNEWLKTDFTLSHQSFSHEIRNTPSITSRVAAILRWVILSTSFNNSADSGRMKSEEPLMSCDISETRSMFDFLG